MSEPESMESSLIRQAERLTQQDRQIRDLEAKLEAAEEKITDLIWRWEQTDFDRHEYHNGTWIEMRESEYCELHDMIEGWKTT